MDKLQERAALYSSELSELLEEFEEGMQTEKTAESADEIDQIDHINRIVDLMKEVAELSQFVKGVISISERSLLVEPLLFKQLAEEYTVLPATGHCHAKSVYHGVELRTVGTITEFLKAGFTLKELSEEGGSDE